MAHTPTPKSFFKYYWDDPEVLAEFGKPLAFYAAPVDGGGFTDTTADKLTEIPTTPTYKQWVAQGRPVHREPVAAGEKKSGGK